MNPQQIVALGSTTITPGTQSRWMSTPQGRSTGASGLINYIFDNKKIVSFYENPWSGWTTGGGVCVF
jgi:hypothetical protein